MTLVGWCPGGRPVVDMLARYPGTRVVRVFVGPNDPLPAWDGPILGPLGDQVLLHLSFKRWDLPALTAWLDVMPDRGPMILTYAHEPEQGTAAGDPTPEQFRTRWAELVAALADHPRRGDVLLVPVYTRYWWQANAGDVRWLVPLVDAYGWDIYNNGGSYRAPDDLLSIPRDIARRTGMPYLIAELGAVRLAGDGDGVGRSAWMRAMVDAARTDGALTVCWFHRLEWDLTGPASAGEQQTWRELIQEATSVGVQRRLDWIRRGSPFRLMTPAATLRDLLRRYGYTVYDIGNQDHLEHDPPEDHTPYSATGYPGTAKYGVGYALDIMPPPAGSGLPSLQQLGAQLLADRNAGVAGIRWLKYMNWEPERNDGGPCFKEAWRPTYTRTTSTDRGHIHVSGLTGYETSTIAAGYDPVARIRGVDDMSAEAEQQIANIYSAVFRGGPSMGRTVDPDGSADRPASNSLVAKVDYTMARLDVLVAQLAALAGRDLVDEQAIVAGVLAGLPAEKIAAAIPDAVAEQIAAELAARLAS